MEDRPITVPAEVLSALRTVEALNVCDINDRPVVLLALEEMDFPLALAWLKAWPDKYMAAIDALWRSLE